MATIKKVSKAKNLSAGPSKKTPVAGPVDPKGQFTKVQKRTLGSMKKGGSIKKAQNGDNSSSWDDAKIVKKKETPSGSVIKFKSQGGNYTEKFKWNKGESEPNVTQRRTLRGLLSGAPKAAGKLGKLQPMKKGGKVKKK
jgi:hypothetical protein